MTSVLVITIIIEFLFVELSIPLKPSILGCGLYTVVQVESLNCLIIQYLEYLKIIDSGKYLLSWIAAFACDYNNY